MSGDFEGGSGAGVKRWVGYTCPECRAVFRVPVEAEGRVAECPHCELPIVLGWRAGKGPAGSQKEAPAEVRGAHGRSEEGRSEEEEGTADKPEKRRRFIQKKRGREKLLWDSAEGKSSPREALTYYVFLLVALTFLAGGVAILVKPLLESEPVVAFTLEILSAQPAASGEAEESGGAEDDGILEEIEEIDLKVEAPRIEKAVRNFLSAGEVDGLLGLIRDRGRVEGVVRDYYEKEPLRPTVIKGISAREGIQMIKGFVSVAVELPDLSKRMIGLERTPEGYLVDWESWVGWCEMSWEEFQRTQPKVPVLFRVVVWPVDYYNFDFSDDKEVKSFRLSDLSREHKMYGYVGKYSELARKLHELDADDVGAAVVVRLRYPAEPATRNQVLIDELVCSGWVLLPK